jgi:hypothetical protein
VVYALVVLISLASASISALAQSFVASNPALYRCAVLGETGSCRQPGLRPAVRYEATVELGPRAKYLRHLGADTATAIAQARREGEEPQCRVERITERLLSPEETRSRGLSLRIVPSEERETLFSGPDRTPQPMLHNDWSASLLVPPPDCSRLPAPEGQAYGASR